MTRRSREETQTALVEALLRLAGQHPVEALSVRDIAREAGVNHGLVHRYFGSKEGLVAAAVEQVSRQVHDGAGAGMSTRSFGYLRQHPEQVRVLAQMCLGDYGGLLDAAAPSEAQLQHILAPIRRLLDEHGMIGLDAALVNACAAATFLGWVLFEPFLARAYRLSKDAGGDLEELLGLLDQQLAQ